MMRVFFLISFYILGTSCHSQNRFDSLKVRTRIIKKLDSFPANYDSSTLTSIFGFGHKTSRKITNSELLELTNHPKVTVRTAALTCLVSRHVPETITLFTKNRYDTTNWCNAQLECGMVSITFIDLLLYYFLPNYGLAQNFTLTDEQRQTIIHIRTERKEELYRHYQYVNQAYSN